ncbi:MAG: hypothetical protein ABIR32_11535 [Ilumatobacteraceae bacterium]
MAITPCRLFDTRPGDDNVGPRTSPLAPNDTFTTPVRGNVGNCIVPADATGVVMNVTAVAPSAGTYLTVFPGDVTRPLASNLNVAPGAPPTPNQVTVLLGAALGDIKIYNLTGTVHVLADVVGYYVDHNHDDAYYTKAQVDAAMAAAAGKDVWAQISTAGAAVFGSSGTFTVTHPAVGTYCIRVPVPAALSGAIVSASTEGYSSGVPNSATSGYGWGSACNPLSTAGFAVLPVYVRTGAGVPVDGAFHFYIPAP